jgi:hypothetical protein
MNKIKPITQKNIDIARRLMPSTEPYQHGYIPGGVIEPNKKLSIPNNITRYQRDMPKKISKNKR